MKLIGHPAVFVLLYILLMLPTYVLPFLGSNSAVLNAAGAASGAGLYPAFWLHFLALALLVAITWCRGTVNGHRWLVVFPILALVFDLTPGLNWIFGVPTLMHLAAIILGVALRPQAATIGVQPTAV